MVKYENKSNWRDQILHEFTPNVARLTLVADPDRLFLEEGILADIRKRGLELVPFEDYIAFRYAYETKFRSRWDRGDQTELVVVLHSEARELNTLPYDLLQAGRRLAFGLGEIFPNLSYPVLAALDRRYLDALGNALEKYVPDTLGSNATIDFVLRHVFDITPEFIKEPSDLLRVLLRRHYREQLIPPLLDKRFVQLLRQQNGFEHWPLEAIVSDRQAFLAFLQERWFPFLDRKASEEGLVVRERTEPYAFEFSGPTDLPFDHDDIRIYIDNLFLEGLLEAVPYEQAESLSKPWLAVGIRRDKNANRERRMDGLLCNLASTIPQEDAQHGDWFRFARTWAELVALALESDAMLPEPISQKIETLQARIDDALLPWLVNRYAGLSNLPVDPPVMLHHIPRLLAKHVNDISEHKVAFVLVDGLSMDQWIVTRKELAKQRPKYRFREQAVFAWIPTITSVSRQAAFAGEPPMYFPNSIGTTNKEPALWTKFWLNQGLTQQEVGYAKGLGDGALDRVVEMIDRPRIRVIGLVIDKVDKIMHGMELGTAGMHNQVRQWASQLFMTNLIDLLLDNGYCVHLSSDHGNIEATGCGRPAEGAVADQRGERARVYSDSVLRNRVKERFVDALEWPPVGLPEDYFPLLAPGRSAFVRKGISLVGHGGASLEELMVPFVQIDRRGP